MMAMLIDGMRFMVVSVESLLLFVGESRRSLSSEAVV